MKGITKIFFGSILCVLVFFTVSPLFAGGGQGSQSSPAASGAVSANFNATGFPIVKEPVTKRFMIRKPPHIADPATMITLQRYEQMSGVKVNWEVVQSDGFTERVNLVMASNSMPDAIMKGVPDITKTSADGSIIDLTDLIEKYSSGIKELYRQYPAAKQASMSPDGKIYALPTINTLEPNRTGHRNLWINKVWLDRLGLKVPQTMDEFLDVLRAFRDNDANGNGNPSDEIPYVVEFGGGTHIPRVDIFFNSWGIATNS
jgi:putative aldouronate transport system substrate-binding protein